MDRLILEAASFAVLRHHGQMRKGIEGVPYVTHCFDVAQRLMKVGYDDPHMLSAAILHDVVEDTPTTFEELNGFFGYRVTELVRHLTLPKTLLDQYPTGGPEYVAAKLKFQIEAMYKMPEEGCAIKIADKTSNVSSLCTNPPKWIPEVIRAYTDDAERVVHIADDFRFQTSRIRMLTDTFDNVARSLRSMRSK